MLVFFFFLGGGRWGGCVLCKQPLISEDLPRPLINCSLYHKKVKVLHRTCFLYHTSCLCFTSESIVHQVNTMFQKHWPLKEGTQGWLWSPKQCLSAKKEEVNASLQDEEKNRGCEQLGPLCRSLDSSLK